MSGYGFCAKNASNDLFKWRLGEGCRELNPESTLPTPTKRNSGFALGSYFYSLGGFDFNCDEGQVFLLEAHRYNVSQPR